MASVTKSEGDNGHNKDGRTDGRTGRASQVSTVVCIDKLFPAENLFDKALSAMHRSPRHVMMRTKSEVGWFGAATHAEPEVGSRIVSVAKTAVEASMLSNTKNGAKEPKKLQVRYD